MNEKAKKKKKNTKICLMFERIDRVRRKKNSIEERDRSEFIMRNKELICCAYVYVLSLSLYSVAVFVRTSNVNEMHARVDRK